jgi:hypothetical protein
MYPVIILAPEPVLKSKNVVPSQDVGYASPIVIAWRGSDVVTNLRIKPPYQNKHSLSGLTVGMSILPSSLISILFPSKNINVKYIVNNWLKISNVNNCKYSSLSSGFLIFILHIITTTTTTLVTPLEQRKNSQLHKRES